MKYANKIGYSDVTQYEVVRVVSEKTLEISRMSASEDLEMEPVDVGHLVRQVLVSRGMDEGIVMGEDVILHTDARHLERVVDNIVRNAETHGEGLRSVIVRRTLDQALIHFDDGGPGIDAGLAERIFEPFVRGDQADPTSGAGLGMAIVTEHAARIDARVSIGASPLGGARVSIALPLAGSP